MPGIRPRPSPSMGGGIPELNITCPTITPAGTEIVVNGSMEADSNWNGFDTPSTNEQSGTQKHAGTYSRHFIQNDTYEGIQSDALTFVLGDWYLGTGWGYRTDAGAGSTNLSMRSSFGTIIGGANATYTGNKNAWMQLIAAGRSAENGAAGYLAWYTANNGGECYVDDMSVLRLTFASLTTYLGNPGHKYGTYTCTPTVTSMTQCGLLIEYLNATNFVMAIVDRAAGKADLLKCVNGTYTSVINGAITYVAGQVLKVIVNATGDHSLYYNNVQIGVTTNIANSGMGTKVYGFSDYASNAVGVVTTTKNFI